MRFTEEEAKAVKNLVPYAQRKLFVAQLLLNSYHTSTKVNMRSVMNYSLGETRESTYMHDVFIVLELMKRSVELHEIIDKETIDNLYKQWEEYDI